MAGAEVAARLREVQAEILARRPEHAIEPSLDRIQALTTLLGDPQRAAPVIHLTGTNGKTSTARMIETLLRARGLRTGLFTSPHLVSMRERIRVDGVPLAAEQFIAAYEEIAPYLDLVDAGQPAPLSFFEVLTAMAFAAFADAPVDVVVLEVGMGGTWDATNVADGVVAVVTPVSVDHARYLGDTVAEIAADKAGIIKPGAVAVLGQQVPEAAAELVRRAAEVGAAVAREGADFGVLRRELAVGGQRLALRGLLADYDEVYLPLFGEHQAANAACALAAVEAFARPDALGPAAVTGSGGTSGSGEAAAAGGGEPGWPGRATGPAAASALDPGLVGAAFAAVTSPGRLEVVRRSPVVIIDAAHNPAGMTATVGALDEAFAFDELIVVLAVSADKDIPAILDVLEPAAAAVVVTANSSDRSLDPATLAELARTVFGDDRVHVARRLDDAIDQAVTLADAASGGLAGSVAAALMGAGPLDPATALPGDGAPGDWRDGAGAVGPGGSAVVITGSVVTAGDARLLLTGAAEGDLAGDGAA